MEFKHTMVFDTTEELEQGFTYGNKELSIFIVDTALENLKTELQTIPVVSISTNDDDLIYDIMIDRPDMIDTLEQNLESMERYEEYERCQKITDALHYLRNN
jgi:hypothetical protein|tara:strand:- start:171 stop:476 length:306 start_codon:yes stop_codon:yes gene_type:complete